LSFCDPSERAYLRDIERLIQRRLTVIGDEPAAPANEFRGKPKASRGKPKGGPRRNGRNRKRPSRRAA
jgi:ATP-dependent RNA helicase RhlE